MRFTCAPKWEAKKSASRQTVACTATGRPGRPTARSCCIGTNCTACGGSRQKKETHTGGSRRLRRYHRWQLGAGQPVDRLLEERPPRRRPTVPLFSRSEEDDQSLRRLLQRHESRLRPRRQISFLLLSTLLFPQHRPARPALQLLQRRRNLRADLEGRRGFSLQAGKRRRKSRQR